MSRVVKGLLALALLALTACASVLPPKCVGCGETLWGKYKYRVVEGRRYAFHPQHAPEACNFCGGVLAKATAWGVGKRTAEGFDVCRRCDQDAVRDLPTARKLVAQVRAELVGHGLKLPWGPIPVTLRNPDNPQEMGHCDAARTSARKVVTLSVRFKPGMPRTTFKAVAAHELTHAWSYLARCPSDQDLALSEGAANLVQYHYLGKDASPQARFMRQALLADPNPAYGDGMRRLQAYQKAKGLGGVLTVLKTRTTIPRGF